jgi:2-dehydro-3-deoxyglucarate aldolase/4-hydroxy-2-oxoheptanedioate aldolase
MSQLSQKKEMLSMMDFKERLGQGKPLIGTLLTLGVPAIAEMLSRCGFDWLWIDMEHAPLSLEQTQQLIQAKDDKCAAFVRIPANDEVWIKRILDLGADGIIVPQVRYAEEAERAVAATKYPPEGTRSVGIARAHGFGMDFANYVKQANERLMVILQIEHAEGVRNIDSILKVPGIDAIVIGPYDLSGSFGKLGQLSDPEVQMAIEAVHLACKQRGMPIGIFALQPEQGKAYLKKGYQLLALGIDASYLWNAAKSSLEAVTNDEDS